MIKTILALKNGDEISAGEKETNAIQRTSIIESVNDGNDLNVGSVCSKRIDVKIITPQNKLQIYAGDEITVFEQDENAKRKKGVFIAEKPKKIGANTTQIVAYDKISLLDKDVTEWFNALDVFPCTAYDLAKITCEYCGITLANELIENGELLIEKVDFDSVTARQIIRWIGEICGCFCVADENGNALYRWYKQNDVPIVSTRSEIGVRFLYGSLSYEDFYTKGIDRVQIVDGSENTGVSYPVEVTDGNSYIIKSNPFINSSDAGAYDVAENLFYKLEKISYVPCKVSVPCSFNFEAGDVLNIIDANGVVIPTYIMQKQRNGQTEILESFGNYERNGAETLYSTSYSASYQKDLVMKRQIARIQLGLDSIDLSGLVTIESLKKDGTTVIDGSRLQTGHVRSKNYTKEYYLVTEYAEREYSPNDYEFRILENGEYFVFTTTQNIPSGGQIRFYPDSNKAKTYNSRIELIEELDVRVGSGFEGLLLNAYVFAKLSDSGTMIDLENGEILSSGFYFGKSNAFIDSLEFNFGRIGAFDVSRVGLATISPYGQAVSLTYGRFYYSSNMHDGDNVSFTVGDDLPTPYGKPHTIEMKNNNGSVFLVNQNEMLLTGSWKATPYKNSENEPSEIVTKQDLIDLGLINE